jgi:hypothetical protein
VRGGEQPLILFPNVFGRRYSMWKSLDSLF